MRVDLSALRRASTRGLVSAVIFVICGASLPAYLTFQHLHDRQILTDRGVQAQVWVTDIHWHRRGSDTMDVKTVEPPHFESVLGRHQGAVVGDRIDVVFDPLAPGRIALADQPLVGKGDLLFVGIDLLCVLALLSLVLPVSELIRRTWARWRGSPEPAGPPPGGNRPAGPRRRLLAGLETPQVVLVLIVGPMTGAVITAMFAADAVETADALESTGVTTRAVVHESTWTDNDSGWLDVRFKLPDGTEASSYVNAHGQVHYVGESVDVIYARDAPANAQLAGPGASTTDLWIPIGLFVVFAATALTTMPIAAVALVRRGLVRRSRIAGPVSEQAVDVAPDEPRSR